jgi:hypothetical protein
MWTQEEDNLLRDLYEVREYAEIGEILGKTQNAIRNRCWRLRLRKRPAFWTDEEIDVLKSHYLSAGVFRVDLDALAKSMGRGRMSVALKASELGLCNKGRVKRGGRKDHRKYKGDKALLHKALSDHSKRMIAERGHTRGMLGKHHSIDTKKILSAKSQFAQMRTTEEERERRRAKRRETNMARYGTYAPQMKSSNPYSRARGGKREDLDNRYFRSSWEANYARYLNLLVLQGKILRWEYEPETFYFPNVKRGALSYTPDFRLYELDGSIVYHEVKGWMDTKSKTKLRRMKQHFPNIKIVIIDAEQYKSVSQFAGLITGWESNKWDF